MPERQSIQITAGGMNHNGEFPTTLDITPTEILHNGKSIGSVQLDLGSSAHFCNVERNLTHPTLELLRNANIQIEFGKAVKDYSNCWNFTTQEYTCPEDGLYSLQSTISVATYGDRYGNALENLTLCVFVNGSSESSMASRIASPRNAMANLYPISLNGVIELNKGDTFQLWVFTQDSNGNGSFAYVGQEEDQFPSTSTSADFDLTVYRISDKG
jgi:hypothetical protein